MFEGFVTRFRVPCEDVYGVAATEAVSVESTSSANIQRGRQCFGYVQSFSR
jgi:hypothetical protein